MRIIRRSESLRLEEERRDVRREEMGYLAPAADLRWAVTFSAYLLQKLPCLRI